MVRSPIYFLVALTVKLTCTSSFTAFVSAHSPCPTPNALRLIVVLPLMTAFVGVYSS